MGHAEAEKNSDRVLNELHMFDCHDKKAFLIYQHTICFIY